MTLFDRLPGQGVVPRLAAATLAALALAGLIWVGSPWLHARVFSPLGVNQTTEIAVVSLFSMLAFASLLLLVAGFVVRQEAARSRTAIAEGIRVKDCFALHASQQTSQLITHHLRLDGAITEQLQVVIDDTESSAMTLIEQVRKLNDAAATLLDYLGHSGDSARNLEQEIEGSVASIIKINAFVHSLPDMIRRDMEIIQSAAIKEIDGLGDSSRSSRRSASRPICWRSTPVSKRRVPARRGGDSRSWPMKCANFPCARPKRRR